MGQPMSLLDALHLSQAPFPHEYWGGGCGEACGAVLGKGSNVGNIRLRLGMAGLAR